MKEGLKKQDLNRAIALLPETFRTAILLREIERLSYQEIAELTGVSFAIVRSRIAKARAILNAEFKVN